MRNTASVSGYPAGSISVVTIYVLPQTAGADAASSRSKVLDIGYSIYLDVKIVVCYREIVLISR